MTNDVKQILPRWAIFPKTGRKSAFWQQLSEPQREGRGLLTPLTKTSWWVSNRSSWKTPRSSRSLATWKVARRRGGFLFTWQQFSPPICITGNLTQHLDDSQKSPIKDSLNLGGAKGGSAREHFWNYCVRSFLNSKLSMCSD
ncbi:MAG: hypothetical protein IH898_04000 [Planctomycetes bacterium]|nr:hypothetical protein [Planctomycetota bacterium]